MKNSRRVAMLTVIEKLKPEYENRKSLVPELCYHCHKRLRWNSMFCGKCRIMRRIIEIIFLVIFGLIFGFFIASSPINVLLKILIALVFLIIAEITSKIIINIRGWSEKDINNLYKMIDENLQNLR